MSKLDEAKERLLTLRFWLGILVGIFLAISAWIFNNYETSKHILLILAGVGLLIDIIGVLIAIKLIDKKAVR